MPRFKVYVREDAWTNVYIEADSAEDALELLFDPDEIHIVEVIDSEITEVIDVEEIEVDRVAAT